MHDGISLEDFKRVVADFTKEVNELDDRSLESAWNAVGEAYFGIPTDDLSQGSRYLEFALRRYWERRLYLDLGYILKEMVGMR